MTEGTTIRVISMIARVTNSSMHAVRIVSIKRSSAALMVSSHHYAFLYLSDAFRHVSDIETDWKPAAFHSSTQSRLVHSDFGTGARK